MKSFDLKLDSIKFSDSEIKIERGSIVVIVGPNNSGKTTLIDEIEFKLKYPEKNTLNVREVELSNKTIAFKELDEHFVTNLKLLKHGSHRTEYEGFGTKISEFFVKDNIDIKGEWISAFVLYVDTITRLKVVEPTNNISLTKDAYTHPIHYLLRYEELESQLNSDVKDIFNFVLSLHTFAGQKLHLLIGENPQTQGTRFELTKKYDSMLELSEQGDGIKAYIGVLLTLLASVQTILLIDEPENFLHPPQAIKLGKTIGHYSQTKEKQIFITTHSSNLLKGLLETSGKNLQIIRIDKNHSINILNNKICKEIWNDDPVIKCSNLLDGLFHDLVILCESDVDAKFYSMILDQIHPNQDVMFIPSYGKDKIIKMQQALNKLGIENKCIVDFDAIIDKTFMQNICRINNLDFNLIKKEYELVLQSLMDKNKDDIKRAGKQILGNHLFKHYEILVNNFKKHGIYLVEFGELERFVQSKPGKSGKWLSEVINDFDTLLIKKELNTAIEFLQTIINPNDA